MTLHPSALAKIKEAEARHGGDYLRGVAALPGSGYGSRTLGDLALVETGCQLYAREDGDGMRVDDNGDALGGIVLEITFTGGIDEETGEISTRRAFHIYDPMKRLDKAFRVLTEEQVDRDRFEPFDIATVRRAMRRFCREVGEQTGVATMRELKLVSDAARLAALIGSGT